MTVQRAHKTRTHLILSKAFCSASLSPSPSPSASFIFSLPSSTAAISCSNSVTGCVGATREPIQTSGDELHVASFPGSPHVHLRKEMGKVRQGS